MADTVIVTQADQEAAAKFFRYASWEDARENGGSHGPIITARLAEHFARHRLASTQPAPAFPREEVERNLAAYLKAVGSVLSPSDRSVAQAAYQAGWCDYGLALIDAAEKAALLQGKQP